ncbi:hypothetical protein GCM10011309_22350 [Litorimonas cladophorae]|uniref:Uncharacterized protein n=1 Tax=Litorimonas cladophorae TaxID=1220491 RepID=A0A918KRD2_9PROT|nr:hypothetical protein [Litorimonas cladophorae]GGX71665.1 hypothetical protein GCM10011309_22350 [Litorimonas cladophorae]
MLNINTAEAEFKNKIDCQLPYDETATVERLIGESLKISPDATFAVLHEICRAPKGRTTSVVQLKLADLWQSNAKHLLSNEICDVAKSMINGKDLSVDQAITLLDKVAEFPDLGSALNIIYFSCDDKDGKIERHYNKIIERWRAAQI